MDHVPTCGMERQKRQVRRFALFALLLCAACADRGEISFAQPAVSGTLHDIWVANFRQNAPPQQGQLSPPRPNMTRYEKYVISVPPTHAPGEVEWPDGQPDAQTDFVAVETATFRDAAGFRSAIARSDQTGQKEILLFVHGYNVNNAEAVYQLAQVRHDFDVPVPTVLFSWPSAAKAAGYLYDRDSALIARDALEQVIVDLARGGRQKITLLGHSMGNLLIMETLRQIEISGRLRIKDTIGGLFMISPDIDGELFTTQAKRIRTLPDPSVIFVSDQDIALRISAALTGRTNRLGSQIDGASVGDLPISIVDVSALSDGGLAHDVALSSPVAISVLTRLNENTLPSEITVPRRIRLEPDMADR